MEKYPKPSEELIGKRIRILNNNSAGWLKLGQIYTVQKVNRSNYLFVNERYWGCTNNTERHYFEVIDQDIDLDKLMLKLDELIQEKERRDVKRLKRLFRRQQSKVHKHGISI